MLKYKRESDETVQLLIFSRKGQIVHRSEVSSSTSTIDTSDWLPEVYIVRIGEEKLKVVKTN